MDIKLKIISIQSVIIFILLAFILNLNQKPEIISPLATKQIKILSENNKTQVQNVIPTITLPPPTETSIPTASPIPTATLTPFPTLSFNDLEGYFDRYSNQFSVAKDLLKHIASCESGFNSNSVNGDYQGMFQFSTQTWINNRNALGSDPNPNLRLNTEESIKTAAFMIARNLTKAWPNCSK